MAVEHQVGDTIADRFHLTEILGQGGIGITYAAVDEQTQQEVALKVLSLQQLDNWKTLELFERETETLKQLDHPQIPEYIDYLQIDRQDSQEFYLAQELVKGESLAELIAKGWQPNETELKDIAQQILGILTYIHSLVPPVTHRDIKPQNLIWKADGTIMLVDFGAVTDTYQQTQLADTTFVGTYGYMAPEQYQGRAQPASDLYGLGATLLYLHTGKSPAEFPQARLKIDFRSEVNLSPSFADWLEGLLEPTLEDRFQSADVALDALSHPSAKTKENDVDHSAVIAPPVDTPIQLQREQDQLKVTIPANGLQKNREIFHRWNKIMLLLMSPLFLWLAFTAPTDTEASRTDLLIGFLLLFLFVFGFCSFLVAVYQEIYYLRKGIIRWKTSILLLLIYLISVWFFLFGSWVLISTLYRELTPIVKRFKGADLTINRDQFSLVWQWSILGSHKDKQKIGKISQLITDSSPPKLRCYRSDICDYSLDDCLTAIEKQWLEQEINEFLHA